MDVMDRIKEAHRFISMVNS